MNKEKEWTFEEALEQLEAIVEQLEEGDVPLEEAIAIYKKGMDLSRICHSKLDAVQKELAQIVNEDGEISPFKISEEEKE
ncbi:exodeoxyribonuclease VII small subunit [Peribacillus tepidiphilus]|jgi:exodeoxyribonuclease VII small subunit|uniref:exodeoxyribonuclease VII small subunit n=1 Tax=Peribacillus tepidiphilus TaxID=2652445 RepID=UPI00129267A5|nr:exodeoxyribonuclease VII small subunit [Peribacillus tepidiphilus]